jgi:hypothetical protein
MEVGSGDAEETASLKHVPAHPLRRLHMRNPLFTFLSLSAHATGFRFGVT